MVQKDQNRNEWKMPLELFGSFVRETTIVDSSREDFRDCDSYNGSIC